MTKRPPAPETTPTTTHLLPKCPTGITGLDEVTLGGLPRARTSLVCGAAGSGKTLFGVEFLVRGAVQFGEPGVLITFEEKAPELAENVASLGFDLDDLVARRLLVIDHVELSGAEIIETGEFDLEGLFLRIGLAIDAVGAKRVVLDTLEALFSALSESYRLRSELHRLFGWLKDRGVTAVVTVEQGEGTFTRHGIEEYVSDCVIVLDHRIRNEVSTRRLRVAKYRGSAHGANEYPFLIDEAGISVLPVTSLSLDHPASAERFSSGIPGLDAMLGGQGFYRGSSILVSGTAGTGKTSIAASMVDAACRRGERCVFVLLEESPAHVIRNMASIGIDLGQWVERGLLQFHATRPTTVGLELHLLTLQRLLESVEPELMVIDPISNLRAPADPYEFKGALTRLLDYVKSSGRTAVLTSLTGGGQDRGEPELFSSLIDSWVFVREVEGNGERNRVLHLLKSRGMAHSNKLREFQITDSGIALVDAYVGPGGVMVGTARVEQESADRRAEAARRHEILAREAQFTHRRAAIEAQVEALRAEQLRDEADLERDRRLTQEVEEVLTDATAARTEKGVPR